MGAPKRYVRKTAWLLVTLGVLACNRPAAARESALELVPSTAPIVVQFNGLNKATDRLARFLTNSLPDKTAQIGKEIEDAIASMSDGRDLKAITKGEQIIFFVVDLESLKDVPRLGFLVPVSSYANFKASFLKKEERDGLKAEAEGFDAVTLQGTASPYYLVDLKDYLVVTNHKATTQNTVKKEGAGLEKSLSKETVDAFLKHDVSVYVNVRALNKQYGAQARFYKALATVFIERIGSGIEKNEVEALKGVMNGAMALFDDGIAAVLGVDFLAEGIKVQFTAQFDPASGTNCVLKKVKATSLDELGSLPVGSLNYRATNIDRTASKDLATFMSSNRLDSATDDDAATKKAIDAALQELSGAGLLASASTNSPAGKLEVTKYRDGGKAVDSTLALFKALAKSSTLFGLPLKELPDIKEGAETIGPYKLHQVVVSFDIDKKLQSVPAAVRDELKQLFLKTQGEQAKFLIGHSGNTVILARAKEWKTAKEAIEAYMKGTKALNRNETFVAMRKQFPANVNEMQVAEVGLFVEYMANAMIEGIRRVAPDKLPGGLPDIKAPKGEPAYTGMSLVLKPEHAQIDVFVPVLSIQRVRKTVAPLFDLMK